MIRDYIRSNISIVRGLVPKGVDVSVSEKKAVVRIQMHLGKAFLEIESNGKTTHKELVQGDVYEMVHTVKVDFTSAVEDDHAFPVQIGHGGDKYVLNKTKNGKLILTK